MIKKFVFVNSVSLILIMSIITSTIPLGKIIAAPAVIVTQRCVMIGGINNVEITITASGFPSSPQRGVVLVDGMLNQESAFSSTGTMGSTSSGPGGPVFGAGTHSVTAFHDANGNQRQDPGELSASTTFTSKICGLNPCTVIFVPSTLDVTDMNTVTTNTSQGPKIKTVHVEKEFFSCQIQTSPSNIKPKTYWPVIIDVSIYTEIIEGIKDGAPVKTFEVITCNKNATSGDLLGCKKEIPSDKLVTGLVCSQFPSMLPVKMNTVVVSPGIVKTIEAQKEVFKCETPSKSKIIKEVTIFTEILENLSENKTTKAFEVATCLKEISSAKVLACKATLPKLL